MRDHLLIAINGRLHQVRGAEAFLSLSDYLRRSCHLTGTKVVCAEGDCGACSVLVGRWNDGRLVYAAVDSCIQFLYQLDGTHIVTAEGLKHGDTLHPVQQAMVDNFGSQCGYCTPGFVTTIAGIYEATGGAGCVRPCESELREKLSGNLCRCTGYVQILEAAASVDPETCPRVGDIYPDVSLRHDLEGASEEPVRILDSGRTIFLPTTIAEACHFKTEAPKPYVVSGATDIGVQQNKGRIYPEAILCLAKLKELEGVSVADGVMEAGARATWTEVEALVRKMVPPFSDVLRRFGSPQIRNVGTIGGNVINASPIADSLPFLYVTESEFVLTGLKGERRVPVHQFYKGYKKLDLAPDELLTRVRTPLPAAGEKLRLYKISRRRDLDISTFTAAVLMATEGELITRVRLAFGGVGPTVLRLRRTEEFLTGQPLSEDVMLAAGEIARTEITPISDVRGSADYRFKLAENILMKFYHEIAATEALPT